MNINYRTFQDGYPDETEKTVEKKPKPQSEQAPQIIQAESGRIIETIQKLTTSERKNACF